MQEINIHKSNVSYQAYELLPAGVVVTDEYSVIRYVNQQLLKMLDLKSTAEGVGQSARTIFHPEDAAHAHRTHVQF